MKLNIAFLIAASGLALTFALKAAPTPTPTPPPIHVPGKKKLPTPTPKPTPIKIPKGGASMGSSGRPGPIHLQTPTPTVPFLKNPGKVKPTPTVGPIKIPGKVTPTPTPPNLGKVPLGTFKNDQLVDPVLGKKIVPGGPFQLVTPTPTPQFHVGPGLQYVPPSGKKKNGTGKNDVHFWINIDVNPPPPSELGPTLVIPNIPAYQAVPPSPVNYVPGVVAPVPESYDPPPQDAPVEKTSTALRAWNGQEEPPGRAFDQTRVTLSAASDGTASWQFFWQTTGPEAQAARWEIATVPFVGGYTEFPPAGLVGYGDASVNADSPLTENFFAVDFNSFAKNFEQDSVPNKYYMRVVPVDLDGNPVGTPSNFVRIDLP